MEKILYPSLKECNEGEMNCKNLVISEETKRLIKCRAVLNDLYASICNVIHHSYGYDTQHLGELGDLTYRYDLKLSQLIGSFINDSLSETNFKSI